jgi:hypothetical protein
VREGSVRGWRDKLTYAQVELITCYCGTELERLGYPTGDLQVNTGALQTVHG